MVISKQHWLSSFPAYQCFEARFYTKLDFLQEKAVHGRLDANNSAQSSEITSVWFWEIYLCSFLASKLFPVPNQLKNIKI